MNSEKSENFFLQLKNESEKLWHSREINPKIYGFQIQKGSKWNPGLAHEDIKSFEADVGFKFPQNYKNFLSHMNGTDMPVINIYGDSGHNYSYAPGYYSYPRDIEIVKKLIRGVCSDFKISEKDIDGTNIPFILPVVGHRFLVISEKESPVLSIYGSDVIPYASSLEDFLMNDIFKNHAQSKNLKDISVNFWLN